VQCGKCPHRGHLVPHTGTHLSDLLALWAGAYRTTRVQCLMVFANQSTHSKMAAGYLSAAGSSPLEHVV
jgi:hypothetical protein